MKVFVGRNRIVLVVITITISIVAALVLLLFNSMGMVYTTVPGLILSSNSLLRPQLLCHYITTPQQQRLLYFDMILYKNYSFCNESNGDHSMSDQTKHAPYMTIKIPLHEPDQPYCYNLGILFPNVIFDFYDYQKDYDYLVSYKKVRGYGELDMRLNHTMLSSTDGSCTGTLWSSSGGSIPYYECYGDSDPISSAYTIIYTIDDDTIKYGNNNNHDYIPKINMYGRN